MNPYTTNIYRTLTSMVPSLDSVDAMAIFEYIYDLIDDETNIVKQNILDVVKDAHERYTEEYDKTKDSYNEGAMDALDNLIQEIYNIEPVQVFYHTIWMGPINQDWIQKNGDDWSAGRIATTYGTPFPQEILVPTMKSRDWGVFSEWLNDYSTYGIRSLYEIVEDFEKQTGHKITWFDGKLLKTILQMQSKDLK